MTTLPYRTLFAVWMGMVVGCGLLYFALSYAPGQNSISGIATMPPLFRLLNSIYFSTITATTVGFGDLVPHGIAKAFVMVQSILSLFCASIFVAKLVSHRQEVAFKQVHRLSFENVFHQTREGFYISRRDFDALIREIGDTGTLSDRSWSNLSVACHACETFLEEIPYFYSSDADLYTIDHKRESLLIDALRRTLERLADTLAALESKGIAWQERPETRAELKELLQSVADTLPVWRGRSPHGNAGGFETIEGKHRELQAAMR